MSTLKRAPKPQICSKWTSTFWIHMCQTRLPAGVNVKITCGNITCAQLHTSLRIRGFYLRFRVMGIRWVQGPTGRNLAPKETVIIRVCAGLCGGWGGRMLPLLLQQDWIPTGALSLKGHRLKCRPSIWMCWGDGRRCSSAIECAPRELNKAVLPFLHHVLHKGQWVHLLGCSAKILIRVSSYRCTCFYRNC